MNILVVIQNCMQHHWPFYYSVPLYVCMSAKSLQSCPTLCNPMDCKPTRLLCSWDSPGKNTGVGCHALLQGVFLTQGSNPCHLRLLHCRQILYPLSHLLRDLPYYISMSVLTLISKENKILPLLYDGLVISQHIPAVKENWGRPGFDPWVGKIPWRR